MPSPRCSRVNAGALDFSQKTGTPQSWCGSCCAAETGFYYLQSRYYDPSIGRFINADTFASTGQGFLGYDMYVYCNNNPVMLVDSLGKEPTEAIDTDGDGELDCYVYEYTYTYVVTFQMTTIKQTVTGSVYFYTNKTRDDMETIEYPDGFDSHTDLLVVDLTQESNATLYAYQAQKVTSNYRKSIIQCLRQYDLDFNTPWDRSPTSLLTEWNSHMFFSPFDKSAQDIDFDNEEEGWTFIDYCEKAYTRAKKKYFN